MTDTAPQAPAPAVRAKSWPSANMRDALAVASTLIFVAAFGATFALVLSGAKLDPGAAQGLGQFQGTAITQWVGVMGWYFGSSRSSAVKDDTIAAMAKGDGQ